ncbi:MAG: hypothetical protein J1D85_08385 [Bacteroidales bacterium]|nr:hypothetical protein [Bacteroidales bacterium]
MDKSLCKDFKKGVPSVPKAEKPWNTNEIPGTLMLKRHEKAFSKALLLRSQ